MWDGPENAELWRLQREEFAEESAWMKEMNESSNIFKQYMKCEPWDDYNSGAGGAAAGGASPGGASAGGAAASASK